MQYFQRHTNQGSCCLYRWVLVVGSSEQYSTGSNLLFQSTRVNGLVITSTPRNDVLGYFCFQGPARALLADLSGNNGI